MLSQEILPPPEYVEAVNKYFYVGEELYLRYSVVDVRYNFGELFIEPYIRSDNKIKIEIEEEFIYWHALLFIKAIISLPKTRFKSYFPTIDKGVHYINDQIGEASRMFSEFLEVRAFKGKTAFEYALETNALWFLYLNFSSSALIKLLKIRIFGEEDKEREYVQKEKKSGRRTEEEQGPARRVDNIMKEVLYVFSEDRRKDKERRKYKEFSPKDNMGRFMRVGFATWPDGYSDNYLDQREGYDFNKQRFGIKGLTHKKQVNTILEKTKPYPSFIGQIIQKIIEEDESGLLPLIVIEGTPYPLMKKKDDGTSCGRELGFIAKDAKDPRRDPFELAVENLELPKGKQEVEKQLLYDPTNLEIFKVNRIHIKKTEKEPSMRIMAKEVSKRLHKSFSRQAIEGRIKRLKKKIGKYLERKSLEEKDNFFKNLEKIIEDSIQGENNDVNL